MKSMLRKIAIVCCLLFGVQIVVAQQKTVSVRVINQYEAPVRAYSITIHGDLKTYASGSDGTSSIVIAPTDSVLFTALEYEDQKIAFNDLSDGAKVNLQKKFSWKDLFNPMFYIYNGGLWLLLFIVFAETGLFAGFFLPGDSLLFVAGIYSTNLAFEFLKLVGLEKVQSEWLDLMLLISLISLAGILGNWVGYWTGRKIGPAMYHWKDNLFFKKKYLNEAHDFYEKHGGGAIVFARFLPFIRTFAPIIAGIVEMDRKKFVFYNVVGSISWVLSMIFAGHFLQIWVKNQFGIELKDKLELIVIVIIAVTTAPVIWKFFFAQKKSITKE